MELLTPPKPPAIPPASALLPQTPPPLSLTPPPCSPSSITPVKAAIGVSDLYATPPSVSQVLAICSAEKLVTPSENTDPPAHKDLAGSTADAAQKNVKRKILDDGSTEQQERGGSAELAQQSPPSANIIQTAEEQEKLPAPSGGPSDLQLKRLKPSDVQVAAKPSGRGGSSAHQKKN